jgi:hypothetical protein
MPPDNLVSTDIGGQDIMMTPVDNNEITIEQAGEMPQVPFFLPSSVRKRPC